MSTSFESAQGRCPEGAPIPLSEPEIRGNEWSYVKDCLDTGWVSSAGAWVTRFEEQMAAATGTRHAVAMVNGTAALHVALRCVGVEPDDEVAVSTLTFIASANAIRHAGAWPVPIDAEPQSWQLDPARLKEFLEEQCETSAMGVRNCRTGRRVRAVAPVHILGHPVDMDPVLALARRHGLAVIEDAAESLGALYNGRPVGGLADAACFSFNGNKLITTGGGGMLVTDDAALAARARYLSTQAKDDPVEFVHREVGYNYRLTNLQAAVGCAQIEQLDAFVEAKRRIADLYRQAFEDVDGITPMPEAKWALSSYWLYTILVDADVYGEDSRQLLRRLDSLRIETRPLWQPVHASAAHSDTERTGYPVADRLKRDALCLPCSVGLTETQQRRVIAAIRRT